MNEPITRRTAIKSGAALAATATLPFEIDAQEPKRPTVEGYTDQLSYTPGDEVKLHVSCARPVALGVTRVGNPFAPIRPSRGFSAKEQPIPKDASSHGCRWAVAHSFTLPADTPSGYYAVILSALGDDDRAVASGSAFFVVRPKEPGKNAKILLQLSTNTYNAYTNWGGYSLYAYNGRHKVQGRRVSFDRPLSAQFSNWEAPFVEWAEANGYALDYCVNCDLEFHPELLKHYKLVLSVGHDEYWSAPMRDNLEKYIEDGGNVAFFSGNTCCWQVRSEDNGRALACWKQSFGDDPLYKAGDAQDAHLALEPLPRRPAGERAHRRRLPLGRLSPQPRPVHGRPRRVHRAPARPLALRRDESEARRPLRADLPKDKIVGYECDGCELVWKDGLPFPTHSDGTPKNFEVLATCPARWHPDDCEWYEKWEKGRTGNAVVGTYTRGGTVVTVGTTDWSHGLRGNDANIVRITKNVLDKLGK